MVCLAEVWVVQASKITLEGVKVEVDFNKGILKCKTQVLEEDITNTTTSTQVEVALIPGVASKEVFQVIMDFRPKTICKMSKVAKIQWAITVVVSKVKDKIFRAILQITKQ